MGAVAAEPLTDDDPEELGDYQLIGRLGEGGMGTVYLGIGPIEAGQAAGGSAVIGGPAVVGPDGIDGELRLVAIKMIRPDLAQLPEFRERFLREADVARRVARFCTAEVLEVVDPPNGPPYLVTEYLDGLTLTRAVLAGGPLRTGDLERLAVSVAAALTAIHGAGLVHRDLKPSNVILSALGPRVIDFGIARAADAHGVLSHDVLRIGTPAFMSPEQANGQPVTAAADIFAWGGLVTYAGTGVLPFGDGPTPVQLYRVVHLEPNLEGLGPALRPIVAQAMSKDPAERPTAQELFLRLVGMGPPTHPDPAVSRAIRAGTLPAQPARGTPGEVPADAAVGGGHSGDDHAASEGWPPEAADQAGAGGAQPATGPGAAAAGGIPTARGDQAAGDGPATGGAAARGSEGRRARARGIAARRAEAEGFEAGAAEAERAADAARGRRARLAAVLRAQLRPRADTEDLASRDGPTPRPVDATDGRPARVWRDRIRHASLLIMPLLALMLIIILIPVVLRNQPGPSPTPATVAAGIAESADQVRSADPELAARLSLAAFRISPSPATRASLRTSFADTAATNLTGHTDSVLGAAVSPDGRLAATTSADGTSRLWALADLTDLSRPAIPRPLAVTRGHEGWVTAAAFSPGGNLLATVGHDRTAILWDIHDPAHPARVATLRGHEGYVVSVAFSPDGARLATAGHDNTARIWDVHDPARPAQLGVLSGHSGWVRQVAFGPDGRTLATASADHTARLWDVSDPRRPRAEATLTGHSDYVWAVAFSPDGRQLATGGYDGTARLWDVTDPAHPRAEATLSAGLDWVLTLAFAPDGRTLATAGRDGAVHLWDLTVPGEPTSAGRLAGHTDWVQSVAFTPDGQALITAAADHIARVTPLDDPTLLATACRGDAHQLDPTRWRRYLPAIPYRQVC
ncbi:serine/threonine protein kinase [Frankia sp. CN7]|uniref:Serine/threonine protein kinase n=4 Tax=Frankia nepalensis TaxID=1836974 RepID=A0A937USR0_9ACTN|nr:serine/threonine protein kinase [Frankia nepalensis]MBL7630495.1 serine/threonine protein kinase [Frankia nepalensis]